MGNVIESLIPQGRVSLRLLDKDGNTLYRCGSNVVVYSGRHILSRVVFDPTFSNTYGTVDTLKVAGGAVENGGDHFNPEPPSAGDSDLFETDPTKIKVFSPLVPTMNAISDSTRPTTSFFSKVRSSEVDIIVNEIGMFFGLSGPMFAHYTFNSIDLRATTNNALEITWEFYL